MNQSIYSRKTKAFGMPTKWLFFYIFIRFPLFLLSSIVGLVQSCASYFQYLFSDILPPIFYLAILIDFAYFVIGIITFIKLFKLSPSSFKWNMAFLWFGMGYEVLVMLIGRNFSPYMLGRIMGAFIWAVSNLVYFNKRSELFEMEVPPQTPAYVPNYDYVQQPSAPMQNNGFSGNAAGSVGIYNQPGQNAAPASTAARFCPKCGNELAPGAKFCNRCGAPTEEKDHEV